MKNTLRLDHAKKLVIMDKTFAKFAANTRSEEYAHLQQVRRDYPHYEVIQRTIKRNPNKECYHGLTYDFMEDYILTHGDAETVRKNYDEFNEMLMISRCHSKQFRYSVMKPWFLEHYPEIVRFGMCGKPEVEEVGQPQEANRVRLAS